MRVAAKIDAIAVHFPEQRLTNDDLAEMGMSLSAEDVFKKTGIASRAIAGDGETAVDLAEKACSKLFEASDVSRSEIDYLLVCTQSPDFLLPSCCSLLHARLALGKNVAALDINMGCSGFVYGLGVAAGLIGTKQASQVLLVTTDTYSRYLDASDHTTRTLFGDGAAATLISADPGAQSSIGPFVYGSDGSGAEDLKVETGSLHEVAKTSSISVPRITMNGPAVFLFAIREVPPCLDQLLNAAGLQKSQIDHFVLHQANQYMLDHLFEKMDIPEEKRVVAMDDCGNTVSSSIPIALERSIRSGQIKKNANVVLLGFGVGLSWGGVVMSGVNA